MGVCFFAAAAGVTVLAAAVVLALVAAKGRFPAVDEVAAEAAMVVLGFTAGLAAGALAPAGALLAVLGVFDAAAADFLAVLFMIAFQS